MTRSVLAPRWAALLSAAAAVLVCAVLPAHAQEDEIRWAPGQRMQKAVGRLVKKANEVDGRGDYRYDDSVCVLATFLPAGESASFARNLVKGREYLVLGGGDDRMDEMALVVRDEDGNKAAEDGPKDATPVARFTAKASGRYVITATAHKADKGGFVCVVILRKDGWDVPRANLLDATSKLMRRCGGFDRRTEERAAYFHAARGQWALYGSVLPEGQERTITNVDLGTGKRIVLAGGDGLARDVDLFVKDRDDKLVARDEDLDAVPRVFLTASHYQGAKITCKNASSLGPSLTLMAILRQEKP